jgi:hypothetical protein
MGLVVAEKNFFLQSTTSVQQFIKILINNMLLALLSRWPHKVVTCCGLAERILARLERTRRSCRENPVLARLERTRRGAAARGGEGTTVQDGRSYETKRRGSELGRPTFSDYRCAGADQQGSPRDHPSLTRPGWGRRVHVLDGRQRLSNDSIPC